MSRGALGHPQPGPAGNQPTGSMSLLASKSASTRHTVGLAAVQRMTGTVSVGTSAFLRDDKLLNSDLLTGIFWQEPGRADVAGGNVWLFPERVSC